MSKKMRMLQILNLWRLIPAYLIVCVSDNKAIIFEEIQHWKKCTRRTEKSGFDIFSSLMLELKEYRTLLQYRLGGGGGGIQQIIAKNVISRFGYPVY